MEKNVNVKINETRCEYRREKKGEKARRMRENWSSKINCYRTAQCVRTQREFLMLAFQLTNLNTADVWPLSRLSSTGILDSEERFKMCYLFLFFAIAAGPCTCTKFITIIHKWVSIASCRGMPGNTHRNSQWSCPLWNEIGKMELRLWSSSARFAVE